MKDQTRVECQIGYWVLRALKHNKSEKSIRWYQSKSSRKWVFRDSNNKSILLFNPKEKVLDISIISDMNVEIPLGRPWSDVTESGASIASSTPYLAGHTYAEASIAAG